MTTKITEQNISNISNAAVQWQTVVTADGSTATSAVVGYGYFIDTTSAAHTVNLPNTASVGDTIILKDYAGTWGTNNVTISSTLKISGADADGTLSTNNTTVTIVFMDTTKGWTPIQNSTQDALAVDLSYISATGGTVTTSGDYKIHTFTGDGCFVVSQTGAGAGPSVVDYLVVAGGASGGGDRGGGGGAGGFRFFADPSNNPQSGNPGSPLNAPAGITVTATTYPVTVGAGGAGSLGGQQGTNGSNSQFSTITSAGGGFGGGCQGGTTTGSPGGSGGGGRDSGSLQAGGNGNTPPVSPPQGNNGGTSPTSNNRAGGGGGAIAVGGEGSPAAGGGGAGAGLTGFGTSNGECSSSVQYFSGGGEGGDNCAGSTAEGGLGGGGNRSPGVAGVGTAGASNTGGGSGGNNNNTNSGNAGGKGIVVIRYKFQ